MTTGRLISRSLAYCWRTNAAVIAGVATAVAVLAGALLVGDSVRGSLRDLVLRRLGRTDHVVLSSGFFRERLEADLQAHPDFTPAFDGICPVVFLPGFVTVQSGGGRAGQVLVYGVDDRFWRFHGVTSVSGPEGREALLSPALAEELNARQGTVLLVRVQRPSAIPLETLHGRKEDLGQTLRVTMRAVVPGESLGEFSLRAQQGEIRALFVPLRMLQRELGLENRVNTLLVSARDENPTASTATLEGIVRSRFEPEDAGLTLRLLESRHAFSLDAAGGLLSDAAAAVVLEAARGTGLRPQPVFTYLVHTLRSGGREIPYSLVTAMDRPGLADRDSLLLNDWAARDLRVSPGDTVTIEYDVWEDPGGLVTRQAELRVAAIVPVDTRDWDLTPVYPGISDSETLTDWDPPFPIELRRIRPIDEQYWNLHRTTPKAFLPYETGRQLWASRYGSMTSLRFALPAERPLDETRREFARQLRGKLDPLALGMAVRNVRAESLEASQGATDFGEYFVYFSFFLVVSALLLAALFFRLTVEQRAPEVGLLRAVGFRSTAVRSLFLREGFCLSVAGAAVGAAGAVGYAYAMMAALRTWWIGAVGTTALELHLSPVPLAAGVFGGIAAAMACIWLTLRRLAAVSERRLLAGEIDPEPSREAFGARRQSWSLVGGLALAALGAGLILASLMGLLETAAAFFAAGMALLASVLLLLTARFQRPGESTLRGAGWRPLARLGWRNATYRPARSATAMAMIASAAFILIAVDAFRKDEAVAVADRSSGAGGYSLLVESLLPIGFDPASRQGRDLLGLEGFDSVRVEPFRMRPGDDASCLNLYAPKHPRIIAPRDSFTELGRFSFRSSLASTEAERANPWLLLRRDLGDGAVPVIADANSMAYVLHRSLGEDLVLPLGEHEIHLRLVAALEDSIFQGELLMSQENFLRLFPEREGYQFFLIETPAEQQAAVAKAMENALTDFGADVRSTAQRLAEFHQVENTYLSTFQMLGGLGLLLGTFGLGAVLLRNVMERRRELALLRALGYRRAHFLVMVIAENGVILMGGLLTGAVCAAVVIAPALVEQGGRLPAGSLLLLLSGIIAAGLLTSLAATLAALRSGLLSALRSE
jgi:ABC-type lipoprotein release transport system permease subunit